MAAGSLRDRLAQGRGQHHRPGTGVLGAADPYGPDPANLRLTGLDPSTSPDAMAAPADTARLLGDLAKALQQTAERASTLKPAIAKTFAADADGDAMAEPPRAMPQILDPRGWARQRNENKAGWRGQLLSPRMPLTLTKGLRQFFPQLSPTGLAATVGFATLLVLGAVNVLIGYRLQPVASQPPGSAYKAGLPTVAVPARGTVAVPARGQSSTPAAAGTGRGADAELLGRSAALIAAGDIAAARAELARSAAQGSAAARFALAETYDPNMLAAWGRLEPLADVAVARKLYEQAFAAGEQRARRRIAALAGDN